ncbi:PilZ domain-containing protein [Aureimonas populi]|uniref:PilZ domain-containing protein n=1 Tax=Aureimonas populi TaxID=1701758 RepID=A0ABW5CJS3_9HYPH|nr:PilZ domain-containing protein [Aureimonas populi]
MAERRNDPRRRTRLRPGKLLDMKGGFIADCMILDRSAAGVRIRRFEPGALPEEFLLLDEREGERWAARAVWQEKTEAGLVREGLAEQPDRREMTRIAGPYYAVR